MTESRVGRAQARGIKGPWSRPGAEPCSRRSTALGSGDAPAPWPSYRGPPAISRPAQAPGLTNMGTPRASPPPKDCVCVNVFFDPTNTFYGSMEEVSVPIIWVKSLRLGKIK